MASESFWWCGLCRTRVDDRRVTFEEYHEGCGGRCVVLDEEADVFTEARAWQAFRDWCDGTPEQWQGRAKVQANHAYQVGYDEGYEDRSANIRG